MDDKKSTFGYIFMMDEISISWKSVKQTLTASYTMEVEYVTCFKVTCHVICEAPNPEGHFFIFFILAIGQVCRDRVTLSRL